MNISKRKWFYITVIMLAAYIVKNIFVGADYDEGYATVLSYRLAMGDRLLLEMWEPHQTSAVFMTFFIKIFLWISGGSIAFLTIYLRIIYFLIHGLLSVLIYHTFRVCSANVGENGAKWLALIFFVSSPKCIYIPEYTNLHIWFLTLICLSFMWFYCDTSPVSGKYWLLAAAGVCMACDVLAYPSMILLFPFCLLFILMKRKGSVLKECLAFVVPCVLGMLIFMGYVLSYMTPQQILQVIPYIFGDGSHSFSFWEKVLDLLISFGEIFIVLLIASGVAAVLVLLYCSWRKRKGEKSDARVCFGVTLFLVLMVHQFYCWLASAYNASYPHIIYFYICIVGIYCYCRSDRKEKTGWYLILYSFVNYVGVMLLSNWAPIHLMPFLIVGVLGALMYGKAFWVERHTLGSNIFKLLCGIVVFSNVFGYCYLMIGGPQIHSSILEVRGYYRDGFRKGIFADYMSAYRYNDNQEIWAEAVPAGSTVLYVGPAQYYYMLGDCKLATGSSISTPTYDESLLAYWKLNPDRYPDVVVFESWYGDISSAGEDDFIMKWVENEFQASEVIEYSFITVYRK